MVNHTYSVLLKARGTQPQGNPLTPASLVTTPPDTTATHGAAKPHCGKRDNPQTHIEQTTAGALCPQITQRMGCFQVRRPGEALSSLPPHRTLGSYC